MEPTESLLKNIGDASYEHLSAEAVAATKRIVLDTLGAIVAGTTVPWCKTLADQVKDWAGKQESAVMVLGPKVPAPNAAFANASIARARELDDVDDRLGLHASAVIVPTAFAMAEKRGRVSGKEFITGITLGIDLACRMGLASRAAQARRLWNLTAAYQTFGATVTASRLLGLDGPGMADAMAIAYSQLAASEQGSSEGAFVVTGMLQQGVAAKAAVSSALLAQKGITGLKDVIARYYKSYEQGEYDPQALVADFGQKYQGIYLGVKPYACCRTAQAAVHGTLDIIAESGIRPEDVDEVTVLVNEATFDATCKPLEAKRNPRTSMDAQFSLPYCVASALVRRKSLIEDFTDEAIADVKVLELAQRVTPALNPEVKGRFGRPPAVVQLKSRDGKVYSRREEYIKGSLRNPLTEEELLAKFRYCTTYAAKPLPQRNVEEVIGLVKDLERLDDVTRLVGLLTP
ncbi:MAG: MmgE/PrpD family protein [Chloroflexi bacterium]|nr:MmgE/PrpD family protein [Chloroflexota bacterium]